MKGNIRIASCSVKGEDYPQQILASCGFLFGWLIVDPVQERVICYDEEVSFIMFMHY
jgi:hypothetical protein